MSKLKSHERISNQQMRKAKEIETKIKENSSYFSELNEDQLSLLSRAKSNRQGLERIKKLNPQNSSSGNLDSEL